MTDSTTWSQPSLLDSRPPVRLQFEALVDQDDCTVVLVVSATTYPDKRLIALQSSSPLPFHLVEERAREFGRSFTELLREHTGPFS